MSWISSVLTLLVWALVGASAIAWGLRLSEPAPADLPVPAAQPVQVSASAIAKWLGPTAAPAAEPVASARYALLGVIAQGRRGVALLSVDGQPARPYLVGSLIHEGLILKAVGPRHAELAADRKGPVLSRLELPAPPDLPPPAGLTVLSKASAGR